MKVYSIIKPPLGPRIVSGSASGGIGRLGYEQEKEPAVNARKTAKVILCMGSFGCLVADYRSLASVASALAKLST
jgi:hypothetical protein